MLWLICFIVLGYVIELTVFQGVVLLLFCCSVYLTGRNGGDKSV